MASASDYKFANRTQIASEETVAAIRELLERFHAGSFLEYQDTKRGFAVLGFRLEGGATYLLNVPLPDPKRFSPTSGPVGIKGGIRFRSAYEAERARLYRVLFNLIKMKLVAVEEGVTTLEREFFSDLVIWNGEGQQQTVYEWYAPQVAHLREQGLQPPVLPAIAEPKLLPSARKGE